QWLNDTQYSQLVALAQLLPGPSSSQVGLSIGDLQIGYIGAVMAWLGFTLPSMIMMGLVALLGRGYFHILNSNSFHTIRLIVFSVIAWAFWKMLRSFCKTAWQYAVLILSVALLIVVSVSFNQILVIMLGAVCGLLAGHFYQSDSKPKEINKTAISSPYIR